MRVKRYLVDTMPEAMLQIRKDLGSDAVILSTKETKLGGFLGMFKQRKIEVIAAVEKEEQPKTAMKQPPEAQGIPQMSVPQKAVPQAYKKTAELIASAAGSRAAALGEVETGIMPAESVSANSDGGRTGLPFQLAKEETATSEALSPPGQDAKLAEKRIAEVTLHESVESSSAKNSVEEKLLAEIHEMKAWMAKISHQSMMKQELPDSLQKLQDRLLLQELDNDLIEEWTLAAFERWEESGRSMDEIELFTFMRDQIHSFLMGRSEGGIRKDTKMVYVAGPTGVGKTTTIAKLAAEQLFRYHRKVGLITSDTYRISAVEQLRTYASILNIPLEVIQSPGDIKRASQRLNDCDLILMDTAGRNYRNELLVSELQSLFCPVDHSETYLVLSMTSKSQDMKKITEHFSKYGLDKVIFTKLDETGSYGPIFNLIRDYPLQLSYMTNGQNVPDDLLLAGSRMLSGLLLGEEGT